MLSNRTKPMKYIFSILAVCAFTTVLHAKKTIPMPTPPPPPGVPIDGGLIGLIAAGGALGYREVKKRKDASNL